MSTTIRDVAKSAAVSTATVSRVVNGTGNVSGETRTRVLIAISSLQYYPNAHAAELGRARGSGLPQSRGPVRLQLSKSAKRSPDRRADSRAVHRQTGKFRVLEVDWTRLRRAIAKMSQDDLDKLRNIVRQY